jgi:hypothetical protein
LAKSAHFEIFIFIQNLPKKECDILRQIYLFLISCKRFHSKIHSHEKMTRIKKGFTSFNKIIILAPLNIFASKYVYKCVSNTKRETFEILITS